MTVRDVLVQGRALVQQGWAQQRMHRMVEVKGTLGARREFRDEYCAVGGLAAICHDKGDGVRPAFMRLVAAAGKQGYKSVVSFNDAQGRTQADVVALYDDAIQTMDAETLRALDVPEQDLVPV